MSKKLAVALLTCTVMQIGCGDSQEDNNKASIRRGLDEWQGLHPLVVSDDFDRTDDQGKYSVKKLLQSIRDKSQQDFHWKFAPAFGDALMEYTLTRWTATLENDIKREKLTKEELKDQLESVFIQGANQEPRVNKAYENQEKSWKPGAYFPRIVKHVREHFGSDSAKEIFGFKMDEQRIFLTSIYIYRKLFADYTTLHKVLVRLSQWTFGNVGDTSEN
jgi:hypothetical protein